VVAAPRLPAPRSPPGRRKLPARWKAGDSETAPRPPEPGPRPPEGPCPGVRGSAPGTPIGHVTRGSDCQLEDTPQRGQSAGGTRGRGGGTRVRSRGRGSAPRTSIPPTPRGVSKSGNSTGPKADMVNCHSSQPAPHIPGTVVKDLSLPDSP
jgi:hypothetical protein